MGGQDGNKQKYGKYQNKEVEAKHQGFCSVFSKKAHKEDGGHNGWWP